MLIDYHIVNFDILVHAKIRGNFKDLARILNLLPFLMSPILFDDDKQIPPILLMYY